MNCPNCNSYNIIEILHNKYECLECGHIFLRYKIDNFESIGNILKEIHAQNETYKPKKIFKSRRELVKKLAEQYEYTCITKSEIIDEIIDIELYNQKAQKKGKNNV